MIRALYAGALALLLIAFFATLHAFTNYKKTVAHRKAAFLARSEAQALLGALKDSETGCRGFLLTNDTTYLEPFHLAMRGAPLHLSRLDSMLRDTLNTGRLGTLRSLTGLVLQKNTELVDLALDTAADRSALISSRLDDSKAAMDLFKRRLGNLVNDLDAALLKNAEEESAGRWSTPVMLVFYTLLAILATGLLFNKLFRVLERTQAAEATVRQNVGKLAEEVRTRELVEGTLRQVLDSSPSAIMAFRARRDEQGTIADFEFLFVNDEAERMTGSAKGELIGKRLKEVMPEVTRNGAFEEYVNVVESNAARLAERRTGPHGAHQWLSVQMVPLHDGFVATFTDITERMLAEGLAVEAGNLALADRISRTVAHEVRNPLTNVNLALEQLVDELTVDREAVQPFVDVVQRNSSRIGQLVTQMLESSRKRELNRAPAGVNDLMNNTMSRIADRLALRDMRAEVIPSEKPFTVLVDPELIILALTNIAVNAVEAMEPGSGVLRMRGRSTNDGVSIQVQDNGKGIPPENIGKLFEAFYTGRAGGMGLGLTTARSILNAHGILLQVESAVGQGTTFTLLLPQTLLAQA